VLKPIYRERLRPSRSVIFALLLSGPMVLLAALPFGLELGIALGILVPSALIALVSTLAPTVIVASDFRAGRFSVPLEAIGEVEGFSGEQARLQRGPKLDARAQLLLRGDIDSVVRIEIIDPQDPTPYLLISTRNPEQLVAALRADRA
jgi:hypothetical protein